MTATYKSGYEYLLAYKITVPIYDYTVEFCARCSPYNPSSRTSPTYLSFPALSSPRTHDQMVQAARSGMVNVSEGYKQKSLASYIKLLGVARGSIEELLNDFLSYARQHKIQVWDKERVRREIGESREIWKLIIAATLPTSPSFPTLPTHPVETINLLVDLCRTAGYLQDKLLRSLEEKHAKDGGFTENLFKKRLEHRYKK